MSLFQMTENINQKEGFSEIKKEEESPKEREMNQEQNQINCQQMVEEKKDLHEKERENEIRQKYVDITAIRKIMEPLQPKIITKVLLHNQLVLNSGKKPSPAETQNCIQALQTEFPALRIDLIVRVLHEMLHPQCPKPQIRPSVQETPSEDIPYERSSRIFTSYPDYTVINSEVRSRESVNLAIDPRMPEEKRVAISYLNFGYGVRILRDYIKDPSMNPTKYNNIVTTIMKLAFRKLQEYLKDLGKDIVPINSLEQKILRAPLTNCEKWMPPDHLETFYRLIKYAVNFESTLSIKPNVAINLYNSCIRQLQDRQAKESELKKSKAVKKERNMHVREYQQSSSKTNQEKQPRGRPRGPLNKSLLKSAVKHVNSNKKSYNYYHERYNKY